MRARTGTWPNDHDRLDEIRRRTHVAIAKQIDADPTLLRVPTANIRRWTERAGYLHPADAEWLVLLEESSWADLREILTGTDERAVRLRQSSPFAGMLSQRERHRIRESVRA